MVMVAIAGAESGWNDAEPGDYGLGGPSCGGATSWGFWQVHNVHASYLEAQTGSSDPCVWATWLYDPVHNAEAAWALLEGNVPGGLSNWTTWNTGAYRQYLSQAQAAVEAAGAGGGDGGGGGGIQLSTTTIRAAVPVAVIIGLGLAGVFLAGGIELEEEASYARRQSRR